MDKPALELFLAESTAVAVIGEFDALGSMASALNKRHKVRHTDLQQLLKLAAAQPRDTYERAILVFNIMLFGGAAYDDPMALINAIDLLSAKVKPHWDPGQTHNFKTACIWEPMNVWAGWANENQSNNNIMIDPHVLNHFQGTNVIYTHIGAQNTHVTPNMVIAGRFLPNATARTGLSMSQPQPALQRRNSAHSEMLMRDQPYIEHTINSLNRRADPASDAVVSRQNLEELLRNASVMEQRSTAAGNLHYVELLESLSARNMAHLDAYERIKQAQQSWNIHRGQLNVAISQVMAVLARNMFVSSAFAKPVVQP